MKFYVVEKIKVKTEGALHGIIRWKNRKDWAQSNEPTGVKREK